MQFGVQLPTYWPDYGDWSVRAAIEKTAQVAQTLGYSSIWCNDHVITPAQGRSVGHIIEPLITLASLTHLAPLVQFGTSVLVLPQRNALVVAKQVAALDVLTGGRFILGIGVGWNESEFRFLNADFAQRGAVTDEAIEVMRALWREPQPSFYGQSYRFEDAVFYPKPGADGPPLWIGGSTAPALRRAARVGDAWSPYGIGLADFQVGVDSLRTQVQGRPMPLLAAHLMLHIGSGPAAKEAHIAGDTQAVANRIEQYRQAGLAYLVCGFTAENVDEFLRQMRLFAEEIAPLFGAA